MPALLAEDAPMSKRDKGRIGGQFVPLLHTTLDTPAWRACSHGARSLYVSLKRKYSPNTHNNGRIFLSERDAQKELRSNRDQIRRWFQELQHYGFIVMVKQGSLGVHGKGKAPHWRLPELGMRQGTDLEFPTRDFERWDGIKFKSKKPARAKRRIANLRQAIVGDGDWFASHVIDEDGAIDLGRQPS
jgi:hypothetical protein